MHGMLGAWFTDCKTRRAERNEEAFSDLLLVPVVDGDRRAIAGYLSDAAWWPDRGDFASGSYGVNI